MNQGSRSSSSSRFPTWLDLLESHAVDFGAKPAVRFFQSGEEETARISYQELNTQAKAFAVRLSEFCAPGDRVLLLYPSGMDFVTAFFGCLYAGVVAVPAYPPRANESVHRLKSIVADCGARIALTTRAVLRTSSQVTAAHLGNSELLILATDDPAMTALAGDWQRPEVAGESLAFLQYTSGSTGKPKGVMLSHANLLSNEEMIWQVNRHDKPDECIASWLPLFHDMGLIGILLQGVYSGLTTLLMPPAAFLQKPLRWLQLISRYPVCSSGGPNFGFDLCCQRITEEEAATLDLSRWRNAFNGSEPIHAATLARFSKAFAGAGFRAESFLPCYGMAEASLIISAKPLGQSPLIVEVSAAELAAGRAMPVEQGTGRALVSSGTACLGVELQVVDPTSQTILADGQIGEIWAAGPSMGSGYWNQPELSVATFQNALGQFPGLRFLGTGDLGFIQRGEIFVTGRLKDLIIIRGRNHYPQDLERTAQESHAALRRHGVAAFSVEDSGREQLVIVQEVERTALRQLDVEAVTQAIRVALLREHDVDPAAIVLTKPATAPKTSSGKIQRGTCRTQFLARTLEAVGEWRRPGAFGVEEAALRISGKSLPAEAPAQTAAQPTLSALQGWLVQRVAAALNLAPAAIDPAAPLQALGLDSLGAVSLTGELADYLGINVSPTLVYDLPTIDKIARHFASTPTASMPATAGLVAPAVAPENSAIAIVGLGCRFPGGAINPAAFWELLKQGRDTISEIPGDRWDVDAFYDADPKAPGRMYTRSGGFLDQVDGFDPEFFGISPREAVGIDPQHRLLLEVCWEALEHAAIAPGSLEGRDTGVFVGISFEDYARLNAYCGDPAAIDAYSSLGGARSLAAARLSYHLGLCGPSMVVDTLCSSSLLAVHLAAQSLRAGECRVALAGGANLILSPDTTIASCKLSALAPDGRCKSFDAAADGYARGEGVGIVVLKRLADALADGDPVLAVLRASAVNHDGKSNGLTAPNGLAQEQLLRTALAQAALAPAEVAYVEAHGTGTVLGDPIEVRALGRVYGEGRTVANPLCIGSAKTNIGHLESAAGIAGLIKCVLALQHGELPASLHFKTPNPHIPWSELPVKVVTENTPWPAGLRRLAGVSSFGLGGTNVHAILEAAPASLPSLPSLPSPAPAPPAERPLQLFCLSAQCPAAAVQLAHQWGAYLEAEGGQSLADICFSANTGRSIFNNRLTLAVSSLGQLRERLPKLQAKDFVSSTKPPVVAFLFTGQGSQTTGMARDLYQSAPGFRADLDRCAELFSPLLPVALTEALFGSDDTLLAQTLYAQPALFALEYALGRLWLSWGIRPAAFFGHSIGEYAAACLAGVFSLDAAVTLVSAKARLTHHLPANGGMIVAAASPAALAAVLAAHPEIEIAAFNGPAATTLAGPSAALEDLVAALTAAGVSAQRLPISQAFHSKALDPILAEFAQVAAQIAFQPPTVPIVSCLHGHVAAAEIATPEYWVRQMRDAVQFTRGIQTLVSELGCDCFVEIGPRPSLVSLAQGIVSRDARSGIRWLPSLRPGRPDWATLLGSVGALFSAGAAIDWEAFEAPYSPSRLSGLPTYPFQRRRFWLDGARRTTTHQTLAGVDDCALRSWAVAWLAKSLSAPSATAATPKRWLLVESDGHARIRELARELEWRGESVEVVPVSRLAAMAGVTFHGIVIAESRVTELLWQVQTLFADDAPSRLWLLTENTLPTGRETQPLAIETAPIAGFARAFALEKPSRWGALIDLEAGTEVQLLADELLTGDGEDFVAWRGPNRLVPRLEKAQVKAGTAPIFSAEKTYFVTGGNGGIGSALTAWLSEHGARHVVVFGRSLPSVSVAAGFEKLAATVHVRQGDVSRREDLVQVLDFVAANLPPLAGVFHSAGAIGLDPVLEMSQAAFARVLAPKVCGARLLHELTAALPLDYFVLFSSIASVWGSQGQTHYAAANAYLDALAHARHQAGLPALSVNWGPWLDSGMADAHSLEKLRRIGIAPLSPGAALDWLGQALQGTAPHGPQWVVADIDWQRLKPILEVHGRRPLLSDLESLPASHHRTSPEILGRLRSCDVTERGAVLGAYLQSQLTQILGVAPEQRIDPEQGFFALGMDSLMAVELRTALEADLALKLPSTIAFDQACLRALQSELEGLLFAASAAGATRFEVVSVSAGEPIAIIGMGCRLPGGVASPAAFWELLKRGGHGRRSVPPERWDAAAYYHPEPDHPGTMCVREFGFIDGVDLFDHQFFNIYPREALSMDPQQRLLLEIAWEALENAGLANERLRGSDTGVFVGLSTNDYTRLLLASSNAIDGYFGTGNALSAVPGRIAYVLGLRGPTMVTDTACSSSLVALHQAAQSLRNRECSQAIVAGLNLILAPEPSIALSRAHMLAPDGRCKTFDATADGYGRGEGCGTLILKPLAAALAAGDPVLAVISGSAINQDGASSGFTVPSGHAQQELIRRALAQAGRSADDLDYVEAHGTGTPLGDPIEIHALANVVGAQRKTPLWVGTVKTNLGHLEAAAGIVGVIKTVLALHHGEIPPHLNFQTPSPHIPWSELAIRIPTERSPWPERAGTRVAGVSSFGFTGTNAHVILESAAERPQPAPGAARGIQLIPLSARTPEALLSLRQKMLAWTESHGDAALADVAYALSVGRMHHALRETYLAQSMAELRASLSAALDSALPIPKSGVPDFTLICPEPQTLSLQMTGWSELTDPVFTAALAAAGGDSEDPRVVYFSHQYALGMLWQSWGVAPALVLGEGHGLIAAAVLAGIFELEDALRLVVAEDRIALLSTIVLHPPSIGFGTLRQGRLADAAAASFQWWSSLWIGGETLSLGDEPAARTDGILLNLDESSSELAGWQLTVPSWRPGAAVWETLLESLAALYRAGLGVQWQSLAPGYPHPVGLDLPTYPFQRKRHWVEAAEAPQVRRFVGPAALLGKRLAMAGTTEIRYESAYSAAAPAFLEDHRLFDKVIVPAASHVVLLITAAQSVLAPGPCRLHGLKFLRALTLADLEVCPVQVTISPASQGASSSDAACKIYSQETSGNWALNVEAALVSHPAPLSAAHLPENALEIGESISGTQFYQTLEAAGYTLGPSFCWVSELRKNGDSAVGILSVPADVREAEGYEIHPGLLDSCFQLLGWCAQVQAAELGDGAAIYIPASIEAVQFYARPSGASLRCRVHITEPDHARTHRLRGDLLLTELDGTPIIEVRGFEARRAPRELLVGKTAAAAQPEIFYQIQWSELAVAPSAQEPAHRWLVLGGATVAAENSLCRELAARLSAKGQDVTLAATLEAQICTQVIFVADEEDVPERARALCNQALELVRHLAARAVPPRLWLITRGAQAITGDYGHLNNAQAALIGLGRMIGHEHPELHSTLVDLDPAQPAGEVAWLERVLFSADDENQMAHRNGKRLVARFTAATPEQPDPDAVTQLAIANYGDLDSLELRASVRRAPAPGEVEIEVRAAGLNFRDVLNALGLLKTQMAALGIDSAADLPLGGECAGVVTAVGAGVEQLRVGQPVIAALATGSMGSHVVVDARFVVVKPASWTFAQAASVPVAYLTAHYALRHLARVQPGERVLIHAAAGGVGIASIFIAQMLGAEVLATASPGKWPALRKLGVTILANSRATDYPETICAAGVDVVLNSLNGDHIPRSLEALAPGGRFVEIGKLGIWEPDAVAAKRPDIVYRAFDLVEMSRHNPGLLEQLMQELSADWQAGRLPALPLRTYPLTAAADAFRYMAQARQIGKIVLTRPPTLGPEPKADGVYLVTGGLGGIGLGVARWLAEQGAGTIVLTSRRGPTPEQASAQAAVAALGAVVVWRGADLGRRQEVLHLVEAIVAEFGPLRGVFHAAGVLDDGAIAQQTPERLAAVSAPKVAGAWNLHEATLAQPLDYFVGFSSLAAVLGSFGQSTYAAANAGLDALAHHRQRQGLPALSINWGPWADAGMAARLGTRERERLRALGLQPFSQSDGLAALGVLVKSRETQIAAVAIDPALFLGQFGAGYRPPILRALGQSQASAEAAGLLVAQLRDALPGERLPQLRAALNERLKIALGLGADEALANDQSLLSLGLDSLMAVELKVWIASNVSVELPMPQIAGSSLETLASVILQELGLVQPAPDASPAPLIEDQLYADALLPEAIRPMLPLDAAAPRHILLTGATGFLGAFLLHELLAANDALIHCLVRADTVEAGLERLLKNLRSYGLDARPDRLRIVLGDLAQPGLGLGAGEFERLAAEINVIYHNGAWLNFFYSYEQLKPANVNGTLEVLRLATLGPPKPVHYVSTVGVFYSQSYSQLTLTETDSAERCEGHAVGYSQSKWVAERLVTAAGQRGLPVSIFRAPFITGDTGSGAWNSDDFICRLIRGMIQQGTIPSFDTTLDIVPVDYVARAMVALTQNPSATGTIRHLCAPEPFTWAELAFCLEQIGYPLRQQPYHEWVAGLAALRGTGHPLEAFIPLFMEKSGPQRLSVPEAFLESNHARLDCRHTVAALAHFGVRAPVIDLHLWKTYVEALVREGLVQSSAQ